MSYRSSRLFLLLITCACLPYGILNAKASGTLPDDPSAPVTVAVLPFLSSAIGPMSDLTAVALRDGVVQRLVNDPAIRVVARRRAYALSLDAEIRIADSDSTDNRAAADYVTFGHVIPSKTGERHAVDMVIAVFEVASGDLVVLEKIDGASDHPTTLADKFYDSFREHLSQFTVFPKSSAHTTDHSPAQRVAILPIWILGFPERDDVEVITRQLVQNIESGLREAWPSTTIADTETLLEILEAHGLNQFGGRADAYAASVAEVMGADQVLVAHLNLVQSRESGEFWSLGLITIDVNTGIVTRGHEASFPNLNKLIENTPETVRDFCFSARERPTYNPTEHRRSERLRAEAALYYELATGQHWSSDEANDLDAELRIEMAESALATAPELSDSAFLNLLEKAYQYAYQEPPGIDVYGDHNRKPLPLLTVNTHADFLHLALNARDWEGAESSFEGDCLRVQILIYMDQPEEALSYLQGIPVGRPEQALLLGQIRMLQGRHGEALAAFNRLDTDNPSWLELRAKAAYKVGDHEQEYEALKAHMLKRQRLNHWRTSQRTILLMNDYEAPAKRIELIERFASDWALGTDVAQYTIARARLELGQAEQAIPVLRGILKKQHWTGILRRHAQELRSEIDKLLLPYPTRSDTIVRYVDVQIPPEHYRYYIQPVGYTDTEALEVALEKAEWFSGVDFVLLPPLDAPLHEMLYDVETRQYKVYDLHRWILGTFDMPEDALHYCVVVDRDIRGNNGWFYSTTYPHGVTVVSDYRWRKYFKNLTIGDIGEGLAKSWLRHLQHPIKRSFGKVRIRELTGGTPWPNHIGTIQYSKGTAQEIFEAPFSICETTQKLYASVDWEALKAFEKEQLEDYIARNSEKIQAIATTVGPPIPSSNE